MAMLSPTLNPAARPWLGPVPLPALPALVRRLLLADLTLGTLYLLSRLAFHFFAPPVARAGQAGIQWKFHWLSSVFDLDAEMNVPTWYSSAQLLLVGALLGLYAWAKFDRTKLAASLGLLTAAGVFAFLSMDEVATIHENLGGKLVYYMKSTNHGSAVTLLAFWVAMAVPLLAVLFCVVRATSVHWAGRPRVAAKFAVGLAVFLGSAVGMELAWVAAFGSTPSDAPVEVFVEEMGEMIGVTILVWASLDLLTAARVTLSFGPQGVAVSAADDGAGDAGLTARTGCT